MSQKAKRRIYLDVSLTICLYSFPVLVLKFFFFNENEKQVREGFLFIWTAFFWTDNHVEV